jgi:AraC-like DNA-binding protein/effector-binding domain-containing protein
MPTERDVLRLLDTIRRGLAGDLSLEALADRAGWSRFHFHRAFRRVTGETPKQYTLRLRVERAAARLLTHNESVLGVATGVGFASHEVFTRAFRRHFGCTPLDYRARARRELLMDARVRHAALTDAAGPCVGLFHIPVDPPRRVAMPLLSIERRELTAQHILFARLRAARQELSTAIGEGVGRVYMYAQKAGLALAGHPFTRYLSTGPGLLTIEVGFRFAESVRGHGDVEAGMLAGGPAVVAVHGGPYDQLAETYAGMERWMEQNGLAPGGAPWEHYITDPAAHPDPADWRTEIFWPVSVRT